jgi:hypothetical protein
MASAPPPHDATLSSEPAPGGPPGMNLSGIDLAQLQANGMQALPNLAPNEIMNLLRHLPGVFTKVRSLAIFHSNLFCAIVYSRL